jgi:hypothetical protein
MPSPSLCQVRPIRPSQFVSRKSLGRRARHLVALAFADLACALPFHDAALDSGPTRSNWRRWFPRCGFSMRRLRLGLVSYEIDDPGPAIFDGIWLLCVEAASVGLLITESVTWSEQCGLLTPPSPWCGSMEDGIEISRSLCGRRSPWREAFHSGRTGHPAGVQRRKDAGWNYAPFRRAIRCSPRDNRASRFAAIASRYGVVGLPLGPGDRRRPGRRMRLRCANSISTRFLSWRDRSNASVLASARATSRASS